MYIYIYTYISFVYIHIYIYIDYIHTYIHTYLHIYICVNIYIYIYVYIIYIYTYIYIEMSKYVLIVSQGARLALLQPWGACRPKLPETAPPLACLAAVPHTCSSRYLRGHPEVLGSLYRAPLKGI